MATDFPSSVQTFNTPAATDSLKNTAGVEHHTVHGTLGDTLEAVQARALQVFSVKDFGAVGDGVTNDRAAIQTAIEAVSAAGGGLLYFPAGEYVISGSDGSYSFPEIDGTFQYANSSYDVQIYLEDINNVTLRFDGATLASSKTDGGYTIMFDGCSNIVIENITMTGQTVMSGSTVSVAGTNAIGFASKTQNSDNITIVAPNISGHAGAVDILGDPASSFRVSNLSIVGAARMTDGLYGVSCRGNGVGVFVLDAFTQRLNRPFFIYDTNGVKVKMLCDDINGGSQSLLKTYTVDTFDIDIEMVVTNRGNTQPCLDFQSQHSTSLQPTPAVIHDVNVRYVDDGSSSGGASIDFSYFANSTLTGTSSARLFDNINISGYASGDLTSQVQLTSYANSCYLDASKFVCANQFDIYKSSSGFYPAKTLTWTPTDGSGAGLTLTTSSCEYTVNGSISGTFNVTYPVTADGSAAVIAGLPIVSRALAANTAAVVIGYTDVGFNLLGLIGANSNIIVWYKNNGANVTNAELSGKAIRGSFVYFA